MSYPETGFLFEETFDADDWDEVMNPNARTDTLSPDRSSCVVPIKVPYAKYKAAVLFCLGYQWVDEELSLRRSTPAFHPVFPWLYCAAITSVRFMSPNAANTETAPYEFAVPAGGYTYAELTVEFRERLYNLWQDWEVDYEYERWVYQERQPFTELVQIDGGTLKAYAPSVTAVHTQPYLAAPHVLAAQSKAKILLHWYQVPSDFVEDEDGYSSKFQAAEKCVNSAEFLGRRTGTLRLESVHLDKKPSPVATDLFEGLRWTYDITFEFLEFDPPVGDAGVTKYGHNLLPGPRSAGATGPRSFKYYYYTDDGTESGSPLFASYDFSKLFTHHSIT
jgi:hypothetical protein